MNVGSAWCSPERVDGLVYSYRQMRVPFTDEKPGTIVLLTKSYSWYSLHARR